MDQVLQYFKQAEKVLDANQFADDEDYEIFMKNVFNEVDGKEYRLACNHDGSAILEKILRAANPHQLRVFFEKIRSHYLDMGVHRYASHVAETWLLTAAAAATATPASEGTTEEEDGMLPSIESQLVDLADLCIQNFTQLSQDSYGTHIIRKVMLLCVGELEDVKGNLPEGISILKRFHQFVVERHDESFNPRQAVFNVQSSAVLQCLIGLVARHLPEKLCEFLQLFFPLWGEDANPEGETLSFFKKASAHEVGSRFMEAVVGVLKPTDYIWFHNALVRKTVDYLVQGKVSNFVLQCHISQCPNPSQFVLLAELLESQMPNLVASHRYGIVLRLAQWVADHQMECAAIVANCVLSAFHFGKTTKNDLFASIVRMQVREQYNASASPQAAGCTLLQILARFPEDHNKIFVDSLLEIETEPLVSLCRHPNASRTIEAYFASRTVSEKVKQRIIRRLVSDMDRLAADKAGSHIVDACWNVAKADLRHKIANALLSAKTKLSDSPHGRLVLNNCRVEEYERDVKGKVQSESSVDRKRAMFAEILADDPGDQDLLPEALKVNASKKTRRNK